MNKTLPVFAALAFGLAAVPASAQDALPPPAGPDAAVEELPPDAPEAAPAEAPGPGPRGRRFGPRREGAGGPGRPGPGGFGPGAGFGPGGGDAALGFLVPMLTRPETAAKIGLAEDKASALAATFADLDAQIKAANEKLPAAFKRQADALAADNVDEAAVLAAVNEVWDLRREVALLQTRKLIAVKTTLDAEQIANARKLLREAWKEFGDKGPRGPRAEGERRPGGPGRGDRPGRRGPPDRPAAAPEAQP